VAKSFQNNSRTLVATSLRNSVYRILSQTAFYVADCYWFYECYLLAVFAVLMQ